MYISKLINTGHTIRLISNIEIMTPVNEEPVFKKLPIKVIQILLIIKSMMILKISIIISSQFVL